MGSVMFFILALIGLIIWHSIHSSQKYKQNMYCKTCGFKGITKKKVPGNFGVEIVLWILLIVPGLIYSVWRASNMKMQCSKCGSTDVIPPDSPMALRNVEVP